MNKIILGMLALTVPFAVMAQSNYSITARVGKLNKPAKAYLLIKTGTTSKVDSTMIVDGKFEFKGSVASITEANIRVVHDNRPMVPSKRSQMDVRAFLLGNNEQMVLTAKDSVKNAVIASSPLNTESDRVDAFLKPIYDQFGALDKEFNEQPEAKKQDEKYLKTLDDRANAIQKQMIDTKLDYVQKNPNQYMAVMAFNSAVGKEFDAIAMEKIFLGINETLRNTYLGKEVAARIASVKKTQEGVEAPEFVQPDIDGKMVKLSDYRGKFVFVDFWASWCAPCRRENPNLVKAYAQYKDKGFEILGVSMDKAADKANWLKAIQEDKLTWKQVGDLKGWENEAGMLYEVTAIPMNFLIDPNGKIIGKYLRGEELEKKLSEVIK
ncbi:TlpA disulfide reductase family protein [Pedobacter terrae]|uniref:TlpA disulfide reductase family protein n=1 Tax=Pedobacter terrae TaxID=405671 RepID=UPI002FF727BF